MPHRRRVKKGSFESHFDEIVKHFDEHHRHRSAEKRKPPEVDPRSIHDRLFEKAWDEKRKRRPHLHPPR